MILIPQKSTSKERYLIPLQVPTQGMLIFIFWFWLLAFCENEIPQDTPSCPPAFFFFFFLAAAIFFLVYVTEFEINHIQTPILFLDWLWHNWTITGKYEKRECSVDSHSNEKLRENVLVMSLKYTSVTQSILCLIFFMYVESYSI